MPQIGLPLSVRPADWMRRVLLLLPVALVLVLAHRQDCVVQMLALSCKAGGLGMEMYVNSTWMSS